MEFKPGTVVAIDSIHKSAI